MNLYHISAEGGIRFAACRAGPLGSCLVLPPPGQARREALGLRRLYAGGAKTEGYLLGLRRLHAGGAKTHGYARRRDPPTLFSSSAVGGRKICGAGQALDEILSIKPLRSLAKRALTGQNSTFDVRLGQDRGVSECDFHG